jgi:hypothetical protein
MTFSDAEPLRTRVITGNSRAEALVIKVFRCAMTGISSGETHCWNIGWQALAAAVLSGEVGPLFVHFYGLARALHAESQRPFLIWPPTCRRLCDDEALALLMIERAQQGDPTGVLVAAAHLGVEEPGDALQATQSLATALTRRGLFVGVSEPEEACEYDWLPPVEARLISRRRKA